ncbi:regulatory protein RecX [Proteobacteria bacterium 005FR1]|nr:regulatory protein RecX [Proteobacteria bacterium 005FR1]
MTKHASIQSHPSFSEDEQQSTGGEPAEVTPGAVRFAAMNLLARREHSRLELKQKLSRRFSAAELIETVIQNLADEALQSDDRFAESFVSVRKGKGQGPIRIATELKMRGVDESIVSRYLDSDDQDWAELAKTACLRKYRAIAEGAAEKAKQMRFLQYRGFTSEQIRQVWKAPD